METVYDKESYREAGSPANLVIPDSVTEISYGVFEGCTSLMEVTL